MQGKTSVRIAFKEPKVEKQADWLDPTVPDDRIIAAVMGIQRERPGERVALVSLDSLILAKAEGARLPTIRGSKIPRGVVCPECDHTWDLK